MRRLKLGAALAVLGALVITSIAVADERRPATVTPVSAHFTATGNVKTHMCTRGNVTLVEKRGTFTGTSTSADARLNGTVRIILKTVVNAGNGFGLATGKFRVRSATRGKAQADLMAVVSSTNRLDGFLRSNAENAEGDKRVLSDHGNDEKAGKLFANVSATLAGSTLTGDIGAGDHANTALIGGGKCED